MKKQQIEKNYQISKFSCSKFIWNCKVWTQLRWSNPFMNYAEQGPLEDQGREIHFTFLSQWLVFEEEKQTNPSNYYKLAMRTSRPHHDEIVPQGQVSTLEYHIPSKQKSVQRWASHSAVKESCRLDPWPGCCHPRATVIIKDTLPRSLFLMK